MSVTDKQIGRRALVSVPRSRGALSGLLLMALGVWGALIPFVGPTFDYSYSPGNSWDWTTARFWLEVLPGAGAFLGGLILLVSANRITASLGAWLGIIAGAWFVVGRDCAQFLHTGSPGTPTGSSTGTRLLESLGFFSGIGALMLLVAATALGRLSVRSARDLHAAERSLVEQQRHDESIRTAAVEDARRDEQERETARHEEQDRELARQRDQAANQREEAVLRREHDSDREHVATERVETQPSGAHEAQVVGDEERGRLQDQQDTGASRLGRRR